MYKKIVIFCYINNKFKALLLNYLKNKRLSATNVIFHSKKYFIYINNSRGNMRKNEINTKPLEDAVQILNDLISKQRNAIAFDKFIESRIETNKQILHSSTDDNSSFLYKSINKQTNLQTVINDDNSITTQELSTVPFVYLQSETIVYPDGTKVFTNFYPSAEKIPSKRVEYSGKSNVTKTTNYDTKGKVKSVVRVVKNSDGSGYEEKYNHKFRRNTRTKFNKNKIATETVSYVNNKLVFKLECDENGTLLKETTYYSYTNNPVKQREIIYYDTAYTIKEYDLSGELCGVTTKFLQKEKNKVFKIFNFAQND